MRGWNFSAGPAAIPQEVIKEVQEELLEYNSSGASIIEIGHRTDIYSQVAEESKNDLIEILKYLNPDVRIIGSDWEGKQYTGHDLPIKMYWHHRNHDYSTSGLRKRIYLAEKNKCI